MLENFKYVNHLGESFGNADGVRIKLSGMRDYEWDYEEDNNSIKRFRRKLTKKSIPMTLLIDPNQYKQREWDPFNFETGYIPQTMEEWSNEPYEIRNRIFEIAEKDVLANKPGRIYLDDYYLCGFIVASEKSGHLNTKYLMQNNFTFLALNRGWIKEKTQYFNKHVEEIVLPEEPEPEITMDAGILYEDFPYDYYYYVAPQPEPGGDVLEKGILYPEYPYDYYKSKLYDTMYNDSFTNSHFLMRIYGPVSEPMVNINGNLYGVHATIETEDYIEIDSYNKTVKLITVEGVETNIFNQRMKGNSIFQKIAPGRMNINWDEQFSMEITLYDERSEPAWS